MKTLKQILELYKPKSQDEDKFVKKHIVVKHKDRNGNGDDVFQATNIKAVGREKERHGYEPGKDEEVYEETEALDEGILDTVKSTVSSIANRFKSKPKQENKPQAPARPTQTQAPARPEKKETNSEPSLKQHIHTAIHTNDPKEYDRAMSGISMHAARAAKVGKYAGKVTPTKSVLQNSIQNARKNRTSGNEAYAAAAIKQAHRAGQNIHHMIHGSAAGYNGNMKEEVEYIEEKLKVSDGIGAWISDFVHSDNPKFEGFSKRKRMKMAQAAFYSAQRGD
jgi:hypothetical protein